MKNILAFLFSSMLFFSTLTIAEAENAHSEWKFDGQAMILFGVMIPFVTSESGYMLVFNFLPKSDVIKLQEGLNSKGYNTGPVDGIVGDKTMSSTYTFIQDLESGKVESSMGMENFNTIK